MRKVSAFTLMAVALSGCVAAGLLPATDIEASRLARGSEVTAPFGSSAYCHRHEDACLPILEGESEIALTPAAWLDLNAVNDYVNRLPQVDDVVLYGTDEYWEVASEAGGDCEDFALRKREELIRRGYPVRALMLATARKLDGGLHAALVVATDRGDFVLDNIEWAILGVDAAPYRFVAVQSGARPTKWFAVGADLVDPRQPTQGGRP